VVLQPIRRAIALEEQSLPASIRQGYLVTRHHLKDILPLWLVWISIRLIWVPLTVPIVFLFGDTLLDLLGHGLMALGHALHLIFELFEAITGHILEEAFHLHKRTAEIIFFWSSLAVAIGLSWYLMRKAHRAALQAVTTVQEQRRALAEASKITLWIRIALIISSTSATLYLFT
jgi:hypothetical protein